MVSCPNCKHSNFDGFAACSRCGAPLGAGAPGAGGAAVNMGAPRGGGGAMDDYQKMMADRAAKAKRNRLIFVVVGLAVVGGGGFLMMRSRKQAAAGQAMLEAGGRFGMKDKEEMGAF